MKMKKKTRKIFKILTTFKIMLNYHALLKKLMMFQLRDRKLRGKNLKLKK